MKKAKVFLLLAAVFLCTTAETCDELRERCQILEGQEEEAIKVIAEWQCQNTGDCIDDLVRVSDAQVEAAQAALAANHDLQAELGCYSLQ